MSSSTFPPPPTSSVDWTKSSISNLQEASHTVNGHIESTYHRSTGKWTPLKFVPDPYMRIHGLAPGLNYGQQVFEGLKAFRAPGTPGSITLFRPDRNAMRLQHSAGVLNMPHVPADIFIEACRAAVALNAEYVPPHETGWSLYCRPLLLASSPQFPPGEPEECTFAVYVLPTASGAEEGANRPPMPIRAFVLDEFDRAAPRAPARPRRAGITLACCGGVGERERRDSAKHEFVDEFSLCGFLGVLRAEGGKEDITLVVPESSCAIDSLTSDSVQTIAKDWGWKVIRRPVSYAELPTFSEVLGAGTAMGMVPIRSITRRRGSSVSQLAAGSRVLIDGDKETGTETVVYIPDDQEAGGPVFQKLSTMFRALQLGKEEDKFGWRFEVQAKDGDLGPVRTTRQGRQGWASPLSLDRSLI
ncbi:hypothetical protein N0V93_009043 [Gnomoniopsis smithogilvyi]|uniref:Uncharacterized protein n=1 Tax=Gnomoniopsis smithogilvyi TaxID=1191159 RepID=A0A9W8YM11_9PEZI|nr:hypothetical protein N0V93_009043 [Gnomoniopsis smithogilvyi]